MKTIDLNRDKLDLAAVLRLAEHGPVLLTHEGKEFIMSPADDFEAEVETLRNNVDFQTFLDERRKSQVRIPLEEIEKEIDEEIQKAAGSGLN